jgi:predicted DsbA family dithiol-disulfide isomerase
MMKPVIAEVISERPDLEYVVVDIDSNRDLALQYDVMGVPTFIIEEDDIIKNRVSGAMTKAKFVDALDA